jgi:RHS repeat-associated protein
MSTANREMAMNLIRQILLWVVLLCAAGAGLAQTREIVVYLHPDITGSPVMATDAAGNVIWKERYAPYGERQVKVDDGRNSLWYTGKSQDPDTGLSYFGARWYDPVLGRFQGVDPSSFNEINPQTFNRYAYGNNNPYKYKDPDGEAALLILFAPVIASAGGAVIAGGLNAAIQYSTTGTVQWGGIGGVLDAMGDGATFGLLGTGAVASRTPNLTQTVRTGSDPAHGLRFTTRNEARQALTGDVGTAANQFFRGATSKSTDFRIVDMEGGGKRFEFFSPARTEGYGKKYVQEVDMKGRVVQEYKDTVGPSGLIDRKWIHGEPGE